MAAVPCVAAAGPGAVPRPPLLYSEGMRPLPFALLWASIGLCILPAGGQQQAQDRAAFVAARAITDPAGRVTALAGFAQANAGTGLAHQAQMLELDTLLQSFPERTAEIHALVASDVEETSAGFERWSEEARLADLLAGAGPAGADLPEARTWAQDAVQAMTEESYAHQMKLMAAKYKLPSIPTKQVHGDFLRTRASFLAALANVDLREKDADAADHALAEAYRLNPLSSEVSSLRGQLALERHQDAEALDDFERAEAMGDLKEPWRAEMLRLYQQIDKGDEAGLNDQIDVVYKKLFPPPFALPPRKLAAGGHTVLLELFTGSGCEPCVAPDLAVESLLGSYSRQDLAVLEFDEHIPMPDPLANPDSVARAATYRVGSTPAAFLDGEELPVVGASRSDVENVVVSFAEAIEDRAAEPTGVQLALTAVRGSGGEITAHVSISAQASPAGQKLVIPAGAVLRFALVQDEVRYSGENGMRFHRMVVRKLVRVSAPALTSGAPAFAAASFRPAEIAQDQTTYLKAYAKGNDRFGEVHFLATDIPMQPNHLAVVAWIEDPSTQAIFDAAYVPVR